MKINHARPQLERTCKDGVSIIALGPSIQATAMRGSILTLTWIAYHGLDNLLRQFQKDIIQILRFRFEMEVNLASGIY